MCGLFFICLENITAEYNFEVLLVKRQQQKSEVRESYGTFEQPWHSKAKAGIEVKYVVAMVIG